MVFYYAAREPGGARVTGSIGAESRDGALAHLRARGLVVTLLETAATARGAAARVGLSLRRSSGSRAAFFRSFATLIGAGISIKRAVETLVAEARDAGFAETLRSVAAEVEGGTSLSESMQRHPADFSYVVRAMVKAGETSGSLAGALESVAELEERQRALRKRVQSALAYPAMVSLAAAGLVAFLLADTMPAFAGMFEQMRVPLPLATRVLVACGAALGRPKLWFAAIGILVAAAALLWSSAGVENGWVAALDRWRLRLPLIGPLLKKAAIVRFARTLGSLLAAGVDAVTAVDAAVAVGGTTLKRALAGAVESLRSGNSFAVPMEAAQFFEPTFLLLVRVGEESGTLDAMLLRVAAYYEIDVDAGLATLTGILEPVLICALGLAIGTIVASVIVPLYSMIGSIK